MRHETMEAHPLVNHPWTTPSKTRERTSFKIETCSTNNRRNKKTLLVVAYAIHIYIRTPPLATFTLEPARTSSLRTPWRRVSELGGGGRGGRVCQLFVMASIFHPPFAINTVVLDSRHYNQCSCMCVCYCRLSGSFICEQNRTKKGPRESRVCPKSCATVQGSCTHVCGVAYTQR